MPPGRPSVPSSLAGVVVAILSFALAASCSRESVHRVLVFLYDGVPPLDADLNGTESGPAAASSADTIDPASPQPAIEPTWYLHPAYKENRCAGCHVSEGGGLIKSVREGLCRTCHPDKPPKKKFVHGPVAVDRCMACHTYHKSRYKGILLADAQTVCFHCHEMSELATDKHHETIETERCIRCHDPHGGDDRFFLLPGAVKEGPGESRPPSAISPQPSAGH